LIAIIGEIRGPTSVADEFQTRKGGEKVTIRRAGESGFAGGREESGYDSELMGKGRGANRRIVKVVNRGGQKTCMREGILKDIHPNRAGGAEKGHEEKIFVPKAVRWGSPQKYM